MSDNKQRIVQEYVPGKQVTLAHLIANPTKELHKKMGLSQGFGNSIGVLTITPSEAAIIAADFACKAANVEIAFVDRFSGSVVITGDVMAVEAALKGVLSLLHGKMGFSPANITSS